MTRIPVAGPWISEREIEYAADAARNGWYGGANLYVDRFEKAMAARIGRRFAIALPSCTSAIHLGLLALGVGPGDEVIVPDVTWIATSAPITYVGAKPVFADIDQHSWCISPSSVERLITSRTRAIIVVNLYGNMADMARLEDLARRHGVPIIEDAAQSVGSAFRGRQSGSFGEVSTLSFNGTKTLTTGEGGMFLTDSSEIHGRVQFLRDHGRAQGPKMFWNEEVAFKYRMSNLQAAVGLAQLERLDELVAKKRMIFGWYLDRMSGDSRLVLNAQAPDVQSTYWMVTVILAAAVGLPKERLISELGRREIDLRPFFYPLSSLPAYSDAEDGDRARADNVVAYALSPLGVNLPSALCLDEQAVDRVCTVLLNVLNEAQRT